MSYTFFQFAKDFYLFLEGQKLRFFFFLTLRYISGLFPYLSIFALGLLITELTKDLFSMSLVYFYVLVIVFATIAHVILRFLSKYQLYKIGTIMRKTLRLSAMNHLLRLHLSWHEDQNTGEKIQKINSGTDELESVIHSIANEWIQIIIGVSATILFFLLINPYYAIYVIFLLALFIMIYKTFMPRLVTLKKEVQILKEKVNGTFTESAFAISSIKTLGMNKHISSKSQNVEEAYKEKSLEARRASQIRTVILSIIAAIASGLFLIWIINDFLAGSIAVGMILTYFTYFSRYTDAQHKAIWEVQRFVNAKVTFERLMTILGSKEFREQEVGKKSLQKWDEFICKKLSFAYKNNLVLKDISFSIKKGEKVAFVGKTGSGKSTITKLLLQLYEPKEGTISFDNTSIFDIKQSVLTQKMTTVMQETELFQTSIEENILAGKSKDSKKLQTVCSIAQLDSLLKKLPKGLQSQVGEKGVKLSGGEKQRIAIARALYRDPEILILDEATSALDSRTEQKIVSQIRKYFAKTTQIIIAHRLSTITHVDRIYVLDKGSIVEEGSHKALLKQKGAYYRLWKVQNK